MKDSPVTFQAIPQARHIEEVGWEKSCDVKMPKKACKKVATETFLVFTIISIFVSSRSLANPLYSLSAESDDVNRLD